VGPTGLTTDYSIHRLHRLRTAVHAADTLDSDPVRHRSTVASQAEDRSGLRPSTLIVAVLVVTALEYAVWCFVQGQGITLTGDEPHYLVIAMSLTHLDPHVLWAYQRVSHTHYIDIGPQLTLAATNTFVGPHGPLSVHDIGLPMLIAPFFAVDGTGGALLGFDLLLAIGFVVLHQRASRLAGLGTAGRWVFAVTMAGPALWLASTQLYPDLVSGLFLAVAFVEIGLAERDGTLGRFSMTAIAVGLGFAPWLNLKNGVPVVIGIVAFAVVAARRRLPIKKVVLTGACIGLLLASRALYNTYYIGHLLGLPQAPPDHGSNGIASILALAFDRHQGMFVQLPILVVGLVGAAFAVRKVAVATIGILLSAAMFLVINGTYTTVVPDPTAPNGQTVANALGNLSFAGRYQWSAVPLLLAFIPFALRRLEVTPRRLAAFGAGVGALWLSQSFPMFLGDHAYFNATIDPFTAWDPTLYPGWWGPLDQLLPTFYGFGKSLSELTTWYQTGAEVLVLLLVAFAVWALGRGPRVRTRRTAVAIAVLGAVIFVVSLAGPRQTLPFGSYRAALPPSGIVTTGGSVPMAIPPVTVRDVGAGIFRVGLSYSSSGNASPTAVEVTATALPHQGSLIQLPADRTGAVAGPVVIGTVPVPAGTTAGIGTVTVRIPTSSTLSVQGTVGPSGHLVIRAIQITKLS